MESKSCAARDKTPGQCSIDAPGVKEYITSQQLLHCVLTCMWPLVYLPHGCKERSEAIKRRSLCRRSAVSWGCVGAGMEGAGENVLMAWNDKRVLWEQIIWTSFTCDIALVRLLPILFLTIYCILSTQRQTKCHISSKASFMNTLPHLLFVCKDGSPQNEQSSVCAPGRALWEICCYMKAIVQGGSKTVCFYEK